MAVVHRGRDEALGRDVAIKIVREGMSKERFETEAKRTASIRNPRVVEVFDVGRDGEDVFLVMELLDGQPLSNLLARERKLSPSDIVAIGVQVCEGLAACHAQGIVHRDIKPANVFVLETEPGEPPRVKVLDFGVAKHVDGATARTDPGVLVGTFTFMSPEQIRGDGLDGRSDLYSLGVLLYRALSGRLPFTGDNVATVISQHLTKKPPPIARLASEPGLSKLGAVIDRLLEKSAADRPQSAAHARQMLVEAQADLAREAGPKDSARSPAGSTVAIVEPEPMPTIEVPGLEVPSSSRGLAPRAAGTEAPAVHDAIPDLIEPSSTAPAEPATFELDVRPPPTSGVPHAAPFGARPLPGHVPSEPWRPPPSPMTPMSYRPDPPAPTPPAKPAWYDAVSPSITKRVAGYGFLIMFLDVVFFRPRAVTLLVIGALSTLALVAFIASSSKRR